MADRLLPNLLLVALLLFAPVTTIARDPDASPAPDLRVARAMFTSGIKEREPVDEVLSLDNRTTSIYFFTELRQLQGHTVVHRWEYEGQKMAELKFKVEGQRWRVYSKKTLNPQLLGKWSVMVTDESGWPLHASMFFYHKPSTATSE